MSNQAIILFDGQCNFCNASVNYIIKYDHHKRFRFAHLQSEKGIELQKAFGLNPAKMDSVVLIQDGRVHFKSCAALRIATHMKYHQWLSLLLTIPRPIRHIPYQIIAKYRYRWFGKSETCIVPSQGIKDRFLA